MRARGPGARPYRGPDRRVAPPGPDAASQWGRVGFVATVGVVGVAVVHAVLNHGGPDARLTDDLWLLAVVLATLFAFGSHRHWLASGTRRACRMVTVGGLVATAASVETMLQANTPPVLSHALMSAAAVALLCSARGPEVDSTASQPSEILTFAGAAIGGWWVARSGLGPLVPELPDPVAAIGSALLWSVAAVMAARRASADEGDGSDWVPTLAILLASSEVLHLTSPDDDAALALVAAALTVAGLLVASVGTVSALAGSALGRRERLQHERAAWLRRARERRSLDRERAHEVDNALLAIEGAVESLRRRPASLSPTQRRLADSLSSELQAVRQMMTDPSTTSGEEQCDLLVVVREQIALARARGCRVELLADLGSSIVRGAPAVVRGVVSNLLVNVERHGGAWAQVTVSHSTGETRLRVRDRGPGIPTAEAAAIFRRGVSGSVSGPGAGLGLYISRRAMRRLGGDLVLEEVAGRGACVVAVFPSVVREERGSPELHAAPLASHE